MQALFLSGNVPRQHLQVSKKLHCPKGSFLLFRKPLARSLALIYGHEKIVRRCRAGFFSFYMSDWALQLLKTVWNWLPKLKVVVKHVSCTFRWLATSICIYDPNDMAAKLVQSLSDTDKLSGIVKCITSSWLYRVEDADIWLSDGSESFRADPPAFRLCFHSFRPCLRPCNTCTTSLLNIILLLAQKICMF